MAPVRRRGPLPVAGRASPVGQRQRGLAAVAGIDRLAESTVGHGVDRQCAGRGRYSRPFAVSAAQDASRQVWGVAGFGPLDALGEGRGPGLSSVERRSLSGALRKPVERRLANRQPRGGPGGAAVARRAIAAAGAGDRPLVPHAAGGTRRLVFVGLLARRPARAESASGPARGGRRYLQKHGRPAVYGMAARSSRRVETLFPAARRRASSAAGRVVVRGAERTRAIRRPSRSARRLGRLFFRAFLGRTAAGAMAEDSFDPID